MSVIEFPFGARITRQHRTDQLRVIHSDVNSSNRFSALLSCTRETMCDSIGLRND